MVDVAAFSALAWEARAVLDALAAVEPAGPARRWRGWLGDGGSCWAAQTGVGPERARTAAAGAPAARLFLSVGCAGALAPSLRAGDLVVATEVLRADTDGRVVGRASTIADPIAQWLAGRGFRVQCGAVLSSPIVLTGAVARSGAAAAGALVVEMESADVSAEAEQRRVPSACLRVVLDEADDVLPLVGEAVDAATGDLRPLRALAALAPRPWTWPAVARLANRQRTAERCLRAALAALLASGGLEALALSGASAAAERVRS